MNALVPIALFGWVPLLLGAFALLPARRAVLLAYLAGWLFLPVAEYDLPGFPDWDKVAATNVGVFLGMLLFDRRRARGPSLAWIDLPMLLWCVSPFATSIANGLGVYDGAAQSLRQGVTWGLPYLVGRRYFSSSEGLRELALWCFVGGLLYVPLCLFEVRMSPQLHHWIYGFHQHDFSQTRRGDGFRPTVFMQHGLMVGMWMSMTALVGLLLWRQGGKVRIGPLPMGLAVAALAGTAVLCKSLGALLLLGVGAATAFVIARTRSALPLAALLAIPLLYVPLRASGWWSGRTAVELASSLSPERADSLLYRIESEDLLVEHALRRPLFGWGGFGRNLVMRDEAAGIVAIVDGLWVLVIGQRGIFGLLCLALALYLPLLAFARRVPPRWWGRAEVVPASALALVLALFLVDSLFNAMINPIYVLVAGGLPSFRLAPRRAAARAVPAPEALGNAAFFELGTQEGSARPSPR